MGYRVDGTQFCNVPAVGMCGNCLLDDSCWMSGMLAAFEVGTLFFEVFVADEALLPQPG